MNDTQVPKIKFKGWSLPTLKAFVFILYPVVMLGLVLSAIGQMNEEGIWGTGTFGLPNVVGVLCQIVCVGFCANGMYSMWIELQSRTGKETSDEPDADDDI